MDIIKIGIDRVLSRSEVLLQKIREFAPFGIIYKNNEWINIETYDECLDSVKMRSFLMNTIIKDFQDDNCLFGAVCINARIDNSQDVIIIYNTSNGKDWYELIYSYTIDKKEITFQYYE